MSNHLATYESLNLGPGSSPMRVSAFANRKGPGNAGGSAVQFTLGTEYCALSETQTLHLIATLPSGTDSTHSPASAPPTPTATKWCPQAGEVAAACASFAGHGSFIAFIARYLLCPRHRDRDRTRRTHA